MYVCIRLTATILVWPRFRFGLGAVFGACLFGLGWGAFGFCGCLRVLSLAMDTKPLLMRRGADGGLQSTSVTNKMRDTPAVRGHLGCFCLLAQLVLWYSCRTSAYSHVSCLRTISTSQVLSDSLRPGSWKAIHGKANHTRWQLCLPRLPANRNTSPTGRGLSCMPGCLQCSSCLDRLKLQPLAKQMFSSSMLSELQLNRTTAASQQASTSTRMPEWQVAFPARAQLHWSYTPGLPVANMWIWRPWTEGTGLGDFVCYSSRCARQVSQLPVWMHRSVVCDCLPSCRSHPAFCHAALLSHARLNVASICACDVLPCTHLRPCVQLSYLNSRRWWIFHFDSSALCLHRIRSASLTSPLRLWFLGPGGVDSCDLPLRLEESSPGAYSSAYASITVDASCYPVPRLEVSSPGTRCSAKCADCLCFLSASRHRLEESSPVTQGSAVLWGLCSSARSRSLDPPSGCGLSHLCLPALSDDCPQGQPGPLCSDFAGLPPQMLAAQWVIFSPYTAASHQLWDHVWSCAGTPLMVQCGLNSVTSWYPFCWDPASRCIPHLVPCQSGLWKLERPAPLRGRDCFRHPYQARRTRRPPLSWRMILRGRLDRSFRPFRLWWLRPLCRHHRHRQFLPAVTMAPRKHLRRRLPQLQLQPRWGRGPGCTQCPCAPDRRPPRLQRLSMTSWPHQALQRVSTYSCLGRRSPLRSRTPGGTRSGPRHLLDNPADE